MSLRRIFNSLGWKANAQEPPAKKQKCPAASDRVTLDVGGTKFVAAASTLTQNSAYFKTLLSDINWSESNDGVEGVFIDQGPEAFGKLLAYMRRGLIKVEDIDSDVLALAEFLMMEKFLLAVKARWYVNIGKGPVLYRDDEAEGSSFDEELAAALFDQEHGGVLKAISAGLFPQFLKQNEIDTEKDFAVLIYCPFNCRFNEVGKCNEGPAISCGGILGALNGLHANGYTLYNDGIDYGFTYFPTFSMAFSRKRHSVMYSSATDIFIPPDDESKLPVNCIKQFAIRIRIIDEHFHDRFEIIAPAEFNDDPSPYAECTFKHATALWLEKHDFVTREKGPECDTMRYDSRFKDTPFELYSRQISRVNG